MHKQIKNLMREGLTNFVKPNGEGIELGVAKGEFSSSLLASGKFKMLYCIDRWADHHHIGEYFDVLNRFRQYNAMIIRSTFEEALDLFERESLDFIYVDGYAHTGQENGKTLYDWYPKLKTGGLFAGHDYHKRWPETVRVVDEFMDSICKEFCITGETMPGQFPSWFCWK